MRETSSATSANVKGAVVLMPKRSEEMRRLIASAAPIRTTTPRTAMGDPCPNTKRSTSLRRAPRAIRKPISCVRSET